MNLLLQTGLILLGGVGSLVLVQAFAKVPSADDDDENRRIIRIVRRVMTLVGASAVGVTILFVTNAGEGSLQRAAGAGLAGGMLLAGALVLGRLLKPEQQPSSSSLGADGSSVAVPGRTDDQPR